MEIREFYKNKRVLITGHTGFKGSWLCQILLNCGANVCGIALKPNTNPNLFSLLELENKIENHYIDIRNFDEVKKVFDNFKPEIVLHLAAQPLVLESYKEPKYTYDVNVMGTVNVCECVRLSNTVRSFINVTTDKVYENIEDPNHYYKEDEKLNGYDPYSNSKSCSELVTQSYINSFFKEKEIAVSTCRAGNVIGGGDFAENRIIPDCVRAVIVNKIIEIRNPNSFRPYQHVLEADFFYLLVAKEQYKNINYSGHFNIGPNEEDCISTGKLVELFANKWENANYVFANLDGPHEANFLKLDSSKARKIFGWKPKWAIEDAISRTVDWYKAYNNKDNIANITNKQINEYLGD